MPTHESSEVLNLKIQVAKAQGHADNSTKVLELRNKLAQVKEREAKTKSTGSKKPKQKSKTNAAKTVHDENEDTSGSGARTTIIRWTDKTNHHMTDSLLGFIEDSASCRQSYGFARGNHPPSANNSGGKRQRDFNQELATKLFLDIDIAKSDKYKDFPLEDLGTSIRNRINAMKKSYAKHRQALGETGHGLVTAGGEITEGSEIANAWDNIKALFPWYSRMALLTGGSPVMDRSAVANSTTQVNLSVLRDEEDEDEAS